jgi:hypothetical protein
MWGSFNLVVSVASGDRRDVAEIAGTLAQWRTPPE